jgi:TfoX/Sxy family transcriptional regulator of competence genes
MASSKEYLEFILGQLSELEEITYRAMMGEFIIYYRGKIVGGIYDDRLLVKPVKSAISYMPIVSCELPYEGAKEMLLVDEVDNKEFLTGLFHAMYDELPTPKPKKKKYNLQFMPLSFCKRKNLTPILHIQQNTLTKDH